MIYQERLDIFAKEVLSIADFMQLFECERKIAIDKMNYVRMNSSNRPVRAGTVHVEDYFEAYKINPQRFYVYVESKELAPEDVNILRQSFALLAPKGVRHAT